MGNVIPIKGSAIGQMGSPYVNQISTSAAVGNYVINDANFPGIGNYLPGWVLVIASQPVANVTLSVSTDSGADWSVLSQTGGGFVFADGNPTVRVNVATATNKIYLYPLATY